MSETNRMLTFLGAAGTVTGSKYLISTEGRKFFLDAGLFQGLKELRLRNWQKPSFDAAEIDAVVLSHAHIDHSGYLPLLYRNHFRGKIYATSATADLLKVLLPDSAHLQEEEAELANRYGFSKHKPALPLYTSEDADGVLKQVIPESYHKPFQVTESVQAIFRQAGHILGSASVEIQFLESGNIVHRLVFSGDLGRWNQPILPDPELVQMADTLLIESTYGNRIHGEASAKELARIVNETAKQKGVLLIPAFAVGRTQELVWMLRELEEKGEIPALPVYVDSPMAVDTTKIYSTHPEDHDLEMNQLLSEGKNPLRTKQFHLVRAQEESKKLNQLTGPMIIISASGMATGGRILHHLKYRLPIPSTTVLLVGFQAAGTRGRALQDGAKLIRIHGENVSVRAKVEALSGLSAHADKLELMRWLKGFQKPPKQTFIVHGEADSAATLANSIHTDLGWNVQVAQDAETINLS